MLIFIVVTYSRNEGLGKGSVFVKVYRADWDLIRVCIRL